MPKNTRKKRQAGKSVPKSHKNVTNWSDVAIRLIDALYDLAQTGNLVALMLLGFVCWVFLITYRIPENSLVIMLNGTGAFLISERYYFFPLIGALFVSVMTNFIQAKVYKSHIQDLSEHRKILVHGLDSGKLQPLKNHKTSGFDVVSDSTETGSTERYI